MNDSARRPGPVGSWLLAIRPRTLPASVSGVIVGSALAFGDGRFDPVPAVAALAVALALQIASNLANDVFDFERGADAKRAHGPTRVTQAGLLSPRQVKAGLAVAIGVAALAGVWLAWHSGPWILVVGAAAILSAVVYTAGPFPLAYLGLGDLFVLIFFGFASVAGTYFVEAGRLSAAPLLVALGPGLLIVGILVVNNLRDVEEDRAAGKRTLVVRLGTVFAKREYLACIVLSYAVVPTAIALGFAPVWAMVSWLSIPMAAKNVRVVHQRAGSALNPALGGTGMLSFAWAILFTAGIVADRLLKG